MIRRCRHVFLTIGLASCVPAVAQMIMVNATAPISDISDKPLGINLNYLMDDDNRRLRTWTTSRCTSIPSGIWLVARITARQRGDWLLTNRVMNVAKAAIDALPDPSDRDLLYVALAEAGMIDFHDPPGWENINNLGKAIGTFEILAKNLEFDCVQLAMLWNTRWILNDEARIVGEGGGRAGVEVLTSEDDPGLENGGFGWTFNSNLELSNDAHGGSNALRTTEKWHHKAIPVERFTPDTHYVFSYWGKQTDPSKWGQAGITLYDGGVKTEAEPNTVDSTYKHARPPNVVRSPSPRTAERRPGGLS